MNSPISELTIREIRRSPLSLLPDRINNPLAKCRAEEIGHSIEQCQQASVFPFGLKVRSKGLERLIENVVHLRAQCVAGPRETYRCDKYRGAWCHRSFRPSVYVMGTCDNTFSETPARQPILTPYILPRGVSLPIPNGRTPQTLQKKC